MKTLLERIEKLEAGIDTASLRKRIEAIEAAIGLAVSHEPSANGHVSTLNADYGHYIISKPRTHNGKRLYWNGSEWTAERKARASYDGHAVAGEIMTSLKTPNKTHLRPLIQYGPRY